MRVSADRWNHWARRAVAAVALVALAGCVSPPDGITPVDDFELQRYLGRWYEIARLDHRFERGLTHVTAEYRLADDGSVVVLNRGYSVEDQEWSKAEGRAKFVDGPDTGWLKVSFFGPFYGGYVIFELDDDYRHSMVTGPNRNYLWLLAREPEVPDALMERFVTRARELGFATDELIRVDHSGEPGT